MTKKLNDNEIIDIVLTESLQLSDIINNDLLVKFALLHNIPKENSYFNAKQEVVARRGYFPGAKKKYSLHLVNMEGVTVDEEESKGLVTRRSDYPEITKDGIKELLNLLVKSDKVSFTKIRKLIEGTRNQMLEMISNGAKQIARPVSFTKDREEYKTLPMHIRGMELWNQLEYEYFSKGTKGYLYRIHGVDVYIAPDHVKDRLAEVTVGDCIVVPFEEERVPLYYDLDVPSIIDFAWDRRVAELIEPIHGKIFKEYDLKEAILTW